MFVQLLFLLIIFGLTYSYLNNQERFTATASAIHQIWAGNCRLSCRQDETRTGQTGVSLCRAESLTNDPNCICDSCPCELVDQLLGPYARERMNVGEVLSHYYYSALETIANGYNSLGTAIASLTPRERQAQFVSSDREGSSENFSFGGVTEITPSRQTSARNKPVPVTKAKSAVSYATDEGPSKNLRGSMSVTNVSPDDEKPDIDNCSKCISQGKTCMRSCPKSKK